MRKKILLILICVACVTFGGCFIEQAPLNDKELGIVAQYAADLLLKYNKNYDDFLLTTEQLTPTPTKAQPLLTNTPTSTPTPTKAQSENPENPNNPTSAPKETPTPTATPTPTEVPDNTAETFAQMANVIGVAGLTVSYEGTSRPVEEGNYRVGDGILTLTKRSDGKLYIVSKFVITNNSDSSVSLNCYAQDLTCILNINATTSMYPCDTICLNDLRFIGVSDDNPDILAPGKSYEAVLIFAVNKDTEISKAALTLINKEKESVVIKIK